MIIPMMVKTGLTLGYDRFRISYQYSFTKEHFSDATNSTHTANAVNGLIPSYNVSDLSLQYQYKFLQIETGINNLTNNIYFTRRASGYPGPGIIPASPRTFYVTLQLKL